MRSSNRGTVIFIYVLHRAVNPSQPLTHSIAGFGPSGPCAALWPQENAEITSYIHEIAGASHFQSLVGCETAFISSLPELLHLCLPGTLSGHDFPLWMGGLFTNGSPKIWLFERIVSVRLGENPTPRPCGRQGNGYHRRYSKLEGYPEKHLRRLDPSAVLLLAENGFTPPEIEETLYTRSGGRR